jgi:hypothetical protein
MTAAALYKRKEGSEGRREGRRKEVPSQFKHFFRREGKQ